MNIYKNPFKRSDRHRHKIWDMLVAKDSDAFVSQDWKMVENDFAADQFEGIHAHLSHDPDKWTLTYPRLKDYRDDWLKGGRAFVKIPFRNKTPRQVIYELTSIDRIEIEGNKALIHKKFSTTEKLLNGKRYHISAQTLYRMHRLDGRWKIVGFVGYMPLTR